MVATVDLNGRCGPKLSLVNSYCIRKTSIRRKTLPQRMSEQNVYYSGKLSKSLALEQDAQ